MEETPKRAWVSAWPLIVVLVINVASLAYITSIVKAPVSGAKDDEILAELALLKSALTPTPTPTTDTAAPVLGTSQEYTNGSLADLLTDAPEATPSSTTQAASGYITPKSQTIVEVYKENATYSPIIDRLVAGQKYPYHSKLNGWYLITLPNAKTGWVVASLIDPVKSNP